MYITKYKLHLQDRQDGARKLAKLVRGIQLYVSRGVLWGSSGGGGKSGYFVSFVWRAVRAEN